MSDKETPSTARGTDSDTTGESQEKDDTSGTSSTTNASSEEPTSTDEDASESGAAGGSGNTGGGAGLLDNLQNLFARAMNFTKDEKKEEVPKVLDEVSFEAVARYIKSGKCKKIITMAGAGISTSAGIPDFRTPGTGLYDNLQEFNLPEPTAVFSIDFFKENPKPFFVLAKALYPGSFKPTVCHYFLKLLNSKGLLLRHYTQNIDTLERVAGIPDDKLIEAHGTFNTSHCTQCGSEYSLPWMKEKIFADEIPTCNENECGGVVKPDVVFFGESLPMRFVKCVQQDFKQCDLLIIMGTSLVVQPFASLADRVPPHCPRLYINLEKTHDSDEMNWMALLMGGSMGFAFDKEDNIRDVFKQATCDDGCQELADLLGWGDELRKHVKVQHSRIDQEPTTAAAPSPKKKSPSPNRGKTDKKKTPSPRKL